MPPSWGVSFWGPPSLRGASFLRGSPSWGCLLPRGPPSWGVSFFGASFLGGLLLGGSSSLGASFLGGAPSWGGEEGLLGRQPPPPVNRITHSCKNITLATTSLRPVKMKVCLQVVLPTIIVYHCANGDGVNNGQNGYVTNVETDLNDKEKSRSSRKNAIQ